MGLRTSRDLAAAGAGLDGRRTAPERVVLLHSSASSARQWDALAAALRPWCEVHAVDLHGHGAQPAWPGRTPLRLADEAALVAPLLARRGGAHVVGHSYGASVALRLAVAHPGRVRSVTAFEPVLFGWLDDADAALAREARAMAHAVDTDLARGDAPAAAARFVDYWSGQGAWSRLSASRRAAIVERMPAVGPQFDAVCADGPTPRALRTLRMPMLFLCGEATVPAARVMARLLRRACPAATHESTPGGHMAPITHAAEVGVRVLQFLREHARVSSLHCPSDRTPRVQQEIA